MRAMEVQKAIVARLRAYSALTDIVSGVFDDVPQDAEFPYVAIGDMTLIPFDTFDTVGDEQTIMIHTWSDYRGRKEVKTIQAHIYGALNRHELDLDNGTLIGCDQELSEDFVDADGLRRHGVQRFRLLVDND